MKILLNNREEEFMKEGVWSERGETAAVEPADNVFWRHGCGCVDWADQLAGHAGRFRWALHDRREQRGRRALQSRTLPGWRYAGSVRGYDPVDACGNARRCPGKQIGRA